MQRIALLKSGVRQCGGLEKYTLRLARAFSSAGHRVSLLTTDCEPHVIDTNGFEVVCFGAKPRLSLHHLLRFDADCRKCIDANDFEIVFGMDRNFCLQTHYRAGNGVHAAYLARRRAFSSFYKRLSFDLNPLHKVLLAMEKATFESPQLKVLFTNSNMVRQEVLEHYRVEPQKVVVVHNGVEWQEFQTPFDEGLSMRSELSRQLGLKTDCFRFLFIGNDYKRKGLDLVLQALALLPNRDVELAVVGKDRNIEGYMHKAQALGLGSRVRFFGPVREIKTFYSISDALIVASMYDPFANVTVEALAMGVQVISSSANGGSEVLTRDELGSVFQDLHDPEELVSCLRRAIERPKTAIRAEQIRAQVADFDFSHKLGEIVRAVSGGQ